MRADLQAALDRSEAFQRLTEPHPRELVDGLTRIAAFLDDPEVVAQVRDSAEISRLIDGVNFPAFVADLIKGVFDANLKVTIEQMEAYAELVKSVSASLDEFVDANQSESRHHLAGRYPALVETILTGVTRLVVKSGEIGASVTFVVNAPDDGDQEEDDDEKDDDDRP